MVKRFLFSVVAFCFATLGFAQDIVQNDSQPSDFGENIVPKACAFSIGPKAGLNYSVAPELDDYKLGIDGNIGFNAGLAANLRFGKRPLTKFADTGRFGIQLEALFSQKSLKTDIEDIKLSCLEVPVLFQWWFLKDFCVEAGATFTGVFSCSPDELKVNNTTFETKEIKGHDIMLSVGAEYKHQSGFSASVRYNLGNSDLAGNFKTKVSTISVGISWMFSIIK